MKDIFDKALLLHQNNKLEEAKISYEEILKINPKHSNTLSLYGLILSDLNQKERALLYLKKAIKIQPKSVYYYNLGVGLKKCNRTEDAIKVFEQAIILKPDNYNAYNNLGLIFNEQGKLNEAISMFDEAIKINPNFSETYYNLGIVYTFLNQNDEAKKMYEKTISLNPNDLRAYNNLSLILGKENQIEEAIKVCEKILSIDSNYLKAYLNLYSFYLKQEKLEEALKIFEKIVELGSEIAEVYFNQSQILLKLGKLEEGFELYEYRKKLEDSVERNFTQPLWLGKESLNGKTILIHSEQGYGDTLQFYRYISMLVKLNTKVIFEVEKPLLSLLKEIGVECVIKGRKLPFFDYHCPLLSLPYAFRTSLETIPAIFSLKINQKKIDYWEKKFENITKPKIALAWSGNPTHKNDHNRSLSLEKLVNFLPKEFEYISLQKEIRDEDKSALENSNISFFGNELKDFEDTAALIENVDLVVSVDTSVAHLAGTLGKKTFILLPFSSDWRWMLNTDDTPWYPSVKLFRQNATCDWDSVLNNIRKDISNFFKL